MIRMLITLALVVAAAGCGFYAGMRWQTTRLAQNPNLFLEEYKAEMGKTAKAKYEKIKKIILED